MHNFSLDAKDIELYTDRETGIKGVFNDDLLETGDDNYVQWRDIT